MVLGDGLVDADGVRHAMTGLLSHATSFRERRLHLGYRSARLLAECVLGRAGATLRTKTQEAVTITVKQGS